MLKPLGEVVKVVVFKLNLEKRLEKLEQEQQLYEKMFEEADKIMLENPEGEDYSDFK